MAISIAQYVDLLFKKLQGVAKTANAAVKSASNESIASPPLLRADVIWTDSGNIPNVAASISGLTQARRGANAVQCAPDITVPPIGNAYPTWLANVTYWVPQEFGATWLPKVYVGPASAANIEATGTQIFAAGSGGNGEYFFDTQAGVLNFIGETIPNVLSNGNVVYISGYQYVGSFGIGGQTPQLTVSLIDNSNAISNSVSNVEFLRFDANSGFGLENLGNGNVKIRTASTFKTWVVANSGPDQPNLVASGGDTVQFVQGNGVVFTSNNTPTGNAYKNLTIGVDLSNYTGNISTTGNITGNNITGNRAVFGNITVGNISANGNVTANGLISNSFVTAAGNITGGNITSNGNIAGGNITSTGNITSSGNITGGNIRANGALLGSSITTTGNAVFGNISTAGQITATGNITGGNIISTNAVIGNIDVGNIKVSGNIIVDSLTSNTFVTAAGNVTGGNIITSGAVLGGNITANYIFGVNSILANNFMPWDANLGLVNDTVDIGSNVYQFRNIYVGNVITPAGNIGNATQIQPATGAGQSGVAFIDVSTDSAADITAGTLYVESIDAAGNITVDTYVEANELFALSNLTVGGYANFLGNLKAQNMAAVTNMEAQFFYGNGFYLTGLNAANLLGSYSNANVANYLPIYNGNILAGNLTVSNSVVIQGNLQVLGNTTTIEANSLTISDKDVTIANGAVTPSQANGAGIIVGASNIANIVYLSTANYWRLYPAVYSPGNISTGGNLNVTYDVKASNVTVGNTLVAESAVFPGDITVGGATTSYFQAYTNNNAANQVLYEANAAQSPQLDFNIVATDPTLMGGSRQASKLLVTTYGNDTEYIEYGGVFINTPVGDFTVDQSGGNVRLLVSPQTNANVSYSVLVTRLV